MASISAYLTQVENQVVSVPAGTYVGADGIWNASPSAGSLNGYLILDAAGANPATNTFPVVVDSRTARMRFQAGSAKIIFRGFKFDGLVDIQGADIIFWDCDFTFTADRASIQTWANSLYNAPRATRTIGSTRTQFYGCTFHDCATAILASESGGTAAHGSTALSVIGCYVHDLYPSRNDDKWHSDVIADNYGPSTITVADGTFAPKFGGGTSGVGGSLTGGGIHQEGHGGVSNNQFRRCWMVGSANVAWENFAASFHLTATYELIHKWANNASPDFSSGGPAGVTINYQTSSGADLLGAPGTVTIGTNDPAALWKATTGQQYGDYLAYLGLTAAPPPTGTRAFRLGVSTGAIGNIWGAFHPPNAKLTQTLTTDLATFGKNTRQEVRMSQVADASIGGALSAGTGWLPSANRGWARYDDEFGYAIAGGATVFTVVLSDFVAGYTVNGTSNSYPTEGNLTNVEKFFTDLTNHFKPGNGLIPGGATVYFEFGNEVNNTLLNSSHAPDPILYCLWLVRFSTTCRAAWSGIQILLAAAAASPTNKLAGDTWTSLFNSSLDSPNWDGVNPDGTGVKKFAALDWFHHVLTGYSNAWAFSGSIVGYFNGIAHHGYWSGESPFNTANARGATFPAAPSSYRLNYGFSHIRDLKDIYQLAIGAGNLPANCRIHLTEVGAVAANYYNSARTYATGAMVFESTGSWNAGTRTWTRATRYVALQAVPINTLPSTHPTFWAVSTAAWGSVAGFDVMEPNEVARNLEEIAKFFFGDTPDADGVYAGAMTGVMSVYSHLDFDAGSTQNFGWREFDLTLKGTAPNDILSRLAAQGALTDTSGGNPTCAITAPFTGQIITAGGPTITVSWSYSHPLGRAQGSWRLQLFNGLQTVKYYDSNFVTGAAGSTTVDLVALAGSLLADTSGGNIVAIVTVRSVDGITSQGTSAPIAFDVQWGRPTVNLTHPVNGQLLTDPTADITAAWTYSDTRASPETSYRVTLNVSTPSGAQLILDSNWQSALTGAGAVALDAPVALDATFPLDGGFAGAVLSYDLGVLAAGFYALLVTVRNANGVDNGGQLILFSVQGGHLFDVFTPWFDNNVGLRLNVGFVASAADPAPTFTDTAPLARQITIVRGRQRELERWNPGQLDAIVDNTDRTFDMNHNQYALPNRRIWLQATDGNETFDLFYGFIDSLPTSWSDASGVDATVALAATDAFKIFQRTELKSAYYYEILGDLPDAYYRLNETTGALLADSSGNDSDGSYPTGTTGHSATGLINLDNDTAIAFDGQNDYATIPTAAQPTNYPFTIELWFSTSDATAPLWYQSTGDSGYYAQIVVLAGVITAQVIAPASDIYTKFGLGGSISATSGAANYADGKGHHLVARFTNDHTAPIIHVDGVNVTSAPTVVNQPQVPSRVAFLARDKQTSVSANALAAATIDEVAIYFRDIGSTAVLAHYQAATKPWDGDFLTQRVDRVLDAIGWPIAAREYLVTDSAAGNTQMGLQATAGQKALDVLMQAAATEVTGLYMRPNGNLFTRDRHALLIVDRYLNVQATFGDDDSSATELPYTDFILGPSDELIRNDVTIASTVGPTAHIQDDASIAENLIASWSPPDQPAIRTDDECRAYAEWVIARYAQPFQRVNEITVQVRVGARNYDDLLHAVLSLDLEDRVRFIYRPHVGDPIDQEAHIEGIRHVIGLDTWTTTYQLSAADTAQYATLDDLLLGKLDSVRLAW